jgi:hypothetical protein
MINAAAKDLSLVRGQPIDSDYIRDELAEIVANHEYEMQIIPQTSYIGSWMACFQGSLLRGNGNLRRTILGAGLQMVQQLTGRWRSSTCRCLSGGKKTNTRQALTSSFTLARHSSSSSARSTTRS